MHPSNRAFWEYCSDKYSSYFHKQNGSVLEVGSKNLNGTIRDLFTEYSRYIGTDMVEGPEVEVVCLAENLNFEEPFDVVASASMLEHDPNWIKSITQMMKQLKDDGMFVVTWGAAKNPPHNHEMSVVCEFHHLPAGQVLRFLNEQGFYVHEFWYEGNFIKEYPHYMKKKKGPKHPSSDGMGEVCLIAFKDKKYAIGESHIDNLIPEDA